MTHRLFTMSATVAVVALAAAFAMAQGATAGDQSPPSVAVQGQPPARQMGPGAGTGPAAGPRAGRGGPRMGRGRAPAPGQAGPANGLRPGLAALDLTGDQRAKITELVRGARDQGAPLRDELQFARRTLHRELFADTRDNAKVASLTTKIAGLEKQASDLRVKTATAVADLLTPEQRETMRLLDAGRRRLGRRLGGPGRGSGRLAAAGPRSRGPGPQ